MNRFIQTQYDKKLPDNYYDYIVYPVFSLAVALEPLLSEIHDLYPRINVAERYCPLPSDNKLTLYESAVIYLYTDDRAEQSIYYQLNRALRSDNPSILKSWLGFLKLFHTILQKLSVVKGIIWRGIHIDVAKYLRENQTIIWTGVSSCSSSLDMIKRNLGLDAVLCSIEAINGKNICGYTHDRQENEVLLLPGTRLRVKKNTLDHSTGERIVYLEEISNDTLNTSTSSSNFASPAYDLSKYESRPDNSTTSYTSTAYVTVGKPIANPSKNEPKLSIDSSVTSFSSGDRYEVMYEKGDKQGYAKFYAISGEVYEGSSANVKANGVGIRICSYGDRFEGMFRHGRMNGYGIYSRGDRYTYVGNLIDDEAYGEGISTWPNGNSYEGYHENGKITGYGTFRSSAGDEYKGKLIDGKAHGTGVRCWPTGDRYQGGFRDDKKHGFGIYTYSRGDKYSGNWINDEMDGDGNLEWPSGTRYTGAFKNGKRHGRGKLTFANGKTQNGDWENDKFIG